MGLLLDTSVLIGADGRPAATDEEVFISAVSVAELHYGVLVAADAARPGRLRVLSVVERTFDPLPLDAAVAREWGRLQATARQRGGRSRQRMNDLAIAATANVYGLALVTHNVKDFAVLDDLVDVRAAGTAGA